MGAVRILAAALVVVTSVATAGAAEITVLSTPTMKGVLDDLAPAFTRATGHTLGLTLKASRSSSGGSKRVRRLMPRSCCQRQ